MLSFKHKIWTLNLASLIVRALLATNNIHTPPTNNHTNHLWDLKLDFFRLAAINQDLIVHGDLQKSSTGTFKTLSNLHQWYNKLMSNRSRKEIWKMNFMKRQFPRIDKMLKTKLELVLRIKPSNLANKIN